MAFSNDGFNERNIYIHNSNDMNKLNSNGPSNFDNSFAKMRSEERRDLVETTNKDQTILVDEVTGNKDNFLLRNNAMNNANTIPKENNAINRAMMGNKFNPFKKQ